MRSGRSWSKVNDDRIGSHAHAGHAYPCEDAIAYRCHHLGWNGADGGRYPQLGGIGGCLRRRQKADEHQLVAPIGPTVHEWAVESAAICAASWTNCHARHGLPIWIDDAATDDGTSEVRELIRLGTGTIGARRPCACEKQCKDGNADRFHGPGSCNIGHQNRIGASEVRVLPAPGSSWRGAPINAMSHPPSSRCW